MKTQPADMDRRDDDDACDKYMDGRQKCQNASGSRASARACPRGPDPRSGRVKCRSTFVVALCGGCHRFSGDAACRHRSQRGRGSGNAALNGGPIHHPAVAGIIVDRSVQDMRLSTLQVSSPPIIATTVELGPSPRERREVDDRLALFRGHTLEMSRHAANENIALSRHGVHTDDGVLDFDVFDRLSIPTQRERCVAALISNTPLPL